MRPVKRLTDTLRENLREITLGSIIFSSLVGCTTFVEKEPVKSLKTVYDFTTDPTTKTGEVLRGALYGERPKKYKVVYEDK